MPYQHLIRLNDLDGLWNYLTQKDVITVLVEEGKILEAGYDCGYNYFESTLSSKGDENNPDMSSNLARLLINKCIAVAADAAGMKFEQLNSLPAGSRRRSLIDDITVVVILVKSSENFV